MNIMALPGISPKTEQWATKLLKELEAPGRTMQVQRYSHWDCAAGEECLSVQQEVYRLQGCDVDLLVAKSLGVMIGLKACCDKIIKPQRAVLIGTPVTAFHENNMDLAHMVANIDIPCLFIQQTNDIVGSCASLRTAVSSAAHVDIIEIPGENHQYKDLKLLARHIRKLL